VDEEGHVDQRLDPCGRLRIRERHVPKDLLAGELRGAADPLPAERLEQLDQARLNLGVWDLLDQLGGAHVDALIAGAPAPEAVRIAVAVDRRDDRVADRLQDRAVALAEHALHHSLAHRLDSTRLQELLAGERARD
jgi:hypothetical protein